MDAAESPERPREAQLVPTVLQWSMGGGSVYVTGSFNHWGERIPLRRSGGDHVVCLNLLPGTYQYKFIVDNEWRYASDQVCKRLSQSTRMCPRTHARTRHAGPARRAVGRAAGGGGGLAQRRLSCAMRASVRARAPCSRRCATKWATSTTA